MPLKFTDDQKRMLLEYEGAQRSHIAAWEGGYCPSRTWIEKVCKVTGKTIQEIWALYPQQNEKRAVGAD